MSNRVPVPRRALAKDGAELPESHRDERPALRQTISVGETFDFTVEPKLPGVMWLEVRRANGEWVQ